MIIKNKIVILLFLLTSSLFAEFEYKVDNTNITISQDSLLHNYDRLRFRGDYSENSFFATVIGDGVNYLGHNYINSNRFESIKSVHSDTPFKTQSNFKDYGDGSVYAKLYRLYGGYEDSDNRVVVGLQNITMGVGRIWTPTNLFNHKNIYAIEADEVFGVMAISYTRYLDETSHVTFVASQKADHSFKYAARYKAFLGFADFAIDAVSSNDTEMIGYEIEGNLADTGVLLRSEGAFIENSLNTQTGENKENFFQGIVGADYGFENGITVVGEALYGSKEFSYQEILLNLDSEILSDLTSSHFYTGLTLSYSFNIFLDASLLYIESYNDKNSRFISPNLTYTLNDNNSFMIGVMIQDGEVASEFGMSDNTYYFKWVLSF
ncbi:MAG: hypothetical protein L3J19_02275 [Sulfurimonas sp.]|nr:hypothetical protein [Sulfurimonas sp.]